MKALLLKINAAKIAQVLLLLLPMLVFASTACVSSGVRPGPAPDQTTDERPLEEAAVDVAINESETPQEFTPPPGDDARTVRSTKPDKKGRRVSTSFSGYELIREVIEDDLGLTTVRITIRGNATIRHENVLITANRMVIEDGTRGKLEGAVKIYDRSSGLRVYAARADYDRDEQMVELSGRPYLTVKQGRNKPTLVTCTKITRDLEAKESVLDGDVRIHHDAWSILGDRGVYYDDENRVVLEANPFLFGKDQFLSGDRLIYEVEDRRVLLDGQIAFLSNNGGGIGPDDAEKDDDDGGEDGRPPGLEEYVRLGGSLPVFGGDSDEANANDTNKANPGGARNQTAGGTEEADGENDAAVQELTALTADRIIHSFPADEEATTEVEGQVMMTRGESLEVRTPALVALGRDFHTIHTEQGVEMRDRSQDMFVRADVMDYQRDEELLRLEGDPEIEFYKKGTDEVEATLRGAVIQRDFAAENTSAWGGVEIERENLLATGEIATFYEDADVIVLEGDPGLKDGASSVRCEKILFYPEKNRILLYNRIRGYLGGEQ
ncbi:MAG: hypothetical protein NXI24_19955 [bacterium]|nr:hypothetical protein [bacterium]